jgi:hypothetical protein
MGIELDPSPRRPRRPQVLDAAFLVLAPIAFVAVLLFGGAQVKQCLGLTGCPGLSVPESGPIPIIGTEAGAILLLVVIGAVWLVAAGLTILYLWSSDRPRLQRAATWTVVLVVVTAAVVAVLRLTEGRGMRIVAEDAGLYAVGVVIVVTPLLLAWAILTLRRPVQDPASRHTSTPSLS